MVGLWPEARLPTPGGRFGYRGVSVNCKMRAATVTDDSFRKK